MPELNVLYPDEAITRLAGKSAHDLTDFFSAVSEGDRRANLRYMPVPKGFRAGSKASIDRNAVLLAKKITGLNLPIQSADKPYLLTMEGMWEAWVRANLGDEGAVSNAVEEWREHRDRIEHDDGPQSDGDSDDASREQLTSDEAAYALFERLSQLAEQQLCAREDLAIAYDFGPFCQSERIQELIDAAPSRRQLESARRLERLPRRVASLDADVNAIELQIRELTSWRDTVQPEFQTMRQTLIDKSDALEKLGGDVRKLSNSYDEIEGALNKVDQTIAETTQGVSSVQGRLDELSSDADTKVSESDFASLKQQVLEQLDEARASIDALRSADLSSMYVTKEDLASALDSSVSKSTDESCKVIGSRYDLPFDLGRIKTAAPTVEIGLRDQFISIVMSALQASGISSLESKRLAFEITAALLLEQIVIFCGQFAGLVAETVSHSLSANNLFHLNMPIGITKPRPVLSKVIESADPSVVPSLLVDGVNRAPIEMIDNYIISRSARRYVYPLERRPACFVFATLDEGPSGLLSLDSLFRLSAVIDTDCLRFQSRYSEEPSVPAGTIRNDVWWSMQDSVIDGEFLDDELLSDLMDLTPISPTHRDTLSRVFSILERFADSEESIDPVQSLAFTWLLPYVASQKIHENESESPYSEFLEESREVERRLKILTREKGL